MTPSWPSSRSLSEHSSTVILSTLLLLSGVLLSLTLFFLNTTDFGSHIRPQADELQGKAVMSYLEIGKKEGVTVMGGDRVKDMQGYFIQPTIFTDIADDSKLNREEVFGPVV